ncbi:MAG: hypothetical protein RJA00_1309 [Bacteroidota bacterium]|jgi:hypothetical protein|nr:DUF3276 family protein [Bacteroidota bacterium]NBX65035.1 DUF3276 family protein [Bacteroidota bacterium]
MMQEENYNRDSQEEIFSKRVRAGKRTYFFDVKATRNNDYYITITESKRSKFDDGNFVKMKIHLYKEDFNKFSDGLAETIGHVKTTLLPEYNFDEYDRQDEDYI